MVNDEEVRHLEMRVKQLEQMVTTLLSTPPPAPAAPAEEEFDFVYPSLEAWVTEEFAPIYARPIGGEFRWCVKWWDHVEAVSRLEGLWRAWERLRLDPVFGMATWYRDYLDISLQGVTSPRGPFARCSPERHEPLKPLPIEAAPAGYWEWPAGFGETESAASAVGAGQSPYEVNGAGSFQALGWSPTAPDFGVDPDGEPDWSRTASDEGQGWPPRANGYGDDSETNRPDETPRWGYQQ